MSSLQFSSIFLFLSTFLVTELSGNCPVELGYIITFISDEECSTSTMTCSEGTDAWSIAGCGCGCKPECVVEGHTIISNTDDLCGDLNFQCPSEYQHWSSPGCGCGCAPLHTDSAAYAAASSLDCVPEGGTLMATGSVCSILSMGCPSGQESWFDSSCGCGCVPEDDDTDDTDTDDTDTDTETV